MVASPPAWRTCSRGSSDHVDAVAIEVEVGAEVRVLYHHHEFQVLVLELIRPARADRAGRGHERSMVDPWCEAQSDYQRACYG